MTPYQAGTFTCPLPITENRNVLLSHGSGGTLTRQLIQDLFVPLFRNDHLAPLHDGAVIPTDGRRIAFSTDSYVINPVFFPGGNIGSLAVNGTINDLAMCGAQPRYISAALILEEGLPLEDLWQIALSMKEAAGRAGVLIVTGDTKVVDHGKGDKIFITTTGIGVIDDHISIAPQRARVGDTVIVSGFIAEHGIAIMSVREGLEFEARIISDTAPLHELVRDMLTACRDIHVLRDPTRGGLAGTMNEITSASGVDIMIEEERLPIREDVKGACEILGLDPLYVANEGKLVALVPPDAADTVLAAMLRNPLGRDARIIGEVVDGHTGTVRMRTCIGGSRIVGLLSGEQLPRIC